MQEHAFELTGGRLCLDFANTVDNRPSEDRRELLKSYFDVVSWSRQTGVIPGREAKRLLRAAGRRQAKAQAVLRRARALREAIYTIFSAVANGGNPAVTELEKLNAALAAVLARSRIIPTHSGFNWEYRAERGALDPMLGAVARSAADLLTSQELATVRECAADNCGWLFLDRSRNRSRRWCDMKVCGNRHKARRYRERHRTAS